MTMELRSINAEVLDEFVSSSTSVHYMKTSAWGEFKKKTEHVSYEMLGFYDNNRLMATAMVLEGKKLGHSYLYVPWGPCMDYQDKDTIKSVFTLLKQHADEKKVQFLRLDPNVIRMHRDILGNPIEDGFSNEAVTDQLKSLGFLHKGYGYAYNGSWTNRYTLIVDLDQDMKDVIAGFSKNRRTSINRHKVEHVSTRLGTKDDIPALMEFEKQLSEQDGFKPHSRKFFTDLLECFGEHAVLYVTEIDLAGMKSGIETELSGKKYAKDPEARAAKEKQLKQAQELMNTYGAMLPIAAGLFIRYGDMSWDLYTYNHKAFNFTNPVDSLHLFAMQDMKEHGVKRYDMCGFSGVTDQSDPYYGLYSYKKSFGGDFTEQIGQFDYVRDAEAMKRFAFEHRVQYHFKRKWLDFRYLKKQK